LDWNDSSAMQNLPPSPGPMGDGQDRPPGKIPLICGPGLGAQGNLGASLTELRSSKLDWLWLFETTPYTTGLEPLALSNPLHAQHHKFCFAK